MHLVDFPLLALIPALPLLGAALTGLFGSRLQRRWGEGVIYWPAILLPWGSFVITVAAVATLAGAGSESILYHRLWSWFHVGWLNAELAFQMDRLSAVMCLVVTFVGSLIHVYSRGYMKRDPGFWRFFSHLNLFMFAMLVLVLGDNFLVMFIGWEGVGLCSYLLIGFWYRETKNAIAGMKAFIVNRIGDFGFSLGVFLLFWGLAAAPGPLGHKIFYTMPSGTSSVDSGSSGATVAAGQGLQGAPASERSYKEWPAAQRGLPNAGMPRRSNVVGAGAGNGGAASPESGPGGTSSGGTARGLSNPSAGIGGTAANEPPIHDAVIPGVRPGSRLPSEGAKEQAEPAPLTSITFREVQQILADPTRRDLILNEKVLGIGLITLVCLLLFVGATGKSAQIPLYVWLPDAMAGPTPVSALIHAATMVTAGVYMVARLHFLFACSSTAMTVVATVGAVTGLFAATIGLFQNDIKKVLAYSTVSQLGFMFLAVGVGAYWVGIFHLVTHAFFKACLFLGSGSVILGCHHEQDMRKMGGLRKLMPITSVTYLLAACAIAGFPFFSGFFSKDEILWKAFDSGNILLPGHGIILWALAAAAALCTSFYMFRSYYMTFSGEYRGGAGHGATDMHGAKAEGRGAAGHAAPGQPADAGHGAHGHLPQESPRSMTWVLAILGVLAVAGGWIGLPHLWGLPNLLEKWLEPVFGSSAPLVFSAGHGSGAEWGLMLFSVVIALGGFGLARWLYLASRNPIPGRLLQNPNPLVRGFYRTVYNKYYVDELYQATFVNGSVGLSRLLALFDRSVIDGLVNFCGTVGRALSTAQGFIDSRVVDGAVNLVGSTAMQAGRSVRKIETGRIQSYVFGLTVGAVLLVVLGYVLAR